MTEYDWNKRLLLTWTLRLTLRDGLSISFTDILSFDDAIKYAKGMVEALNLQYKDEQIGWYDNPEGGGRAYHDKAMTHEYIRITCNQGSGVTLKADSQIDIGTYVDYVCANYSWRYENKGVRHGVRIVGHETIYRDCWITGASFYMTNDSKLDSVDLSSVSRHEVVEFVPLMPMVQ